MKEHVASCSCSCTGHGRHLFCALLTALSKQCCCTFAERNVDVSAVQTVDKPTRDVLVVYDSDGDRQFVGFGGPNDTFADCYISADQLPLDTLTNCAALVTGTLGLAFPSTASAMHKAVETAQAGHAMVSHSGPASAHCNGNSIMSPTANLHLQLLRT